MQLARLVPLIILLAGGLLVGWIWFGDGAARITGTQQAATLLRPDDARLVAMGRDLYARECASCHGANLEGRAGWRTNRMMAPPRDASGHTWHHPDQLLFRMVKEGTVRMGGTMPAFAGRLSDEQIIAVLSWIKSRWPQRIRQAHDGINARAAGG